VCLTDRDHFIEFGKHFGMVNIKFFKKIAVIITRLVTSRVPGVF
jgi:hypothetical protein